ncbi:MAG TPA: alcohol dehydrogenase catalytic domain-containing protein, partial [Terriglobales bacterium]|nr:alcohol dehydrogenase catalytic domain-containing protein [Terriglobales bacterium]
MTAATTVSEVRAYAAMCPGAALEPYRFSHRDLAATDIEIAITHCGICHSDWHLIQNDWGVSSYPLVPGHEIVGTIARLGAEITALRQGQRVGV